MAEYDPKDISPYAPNAPKFDASGFPIGGVPSQGYFALDWQHEANRFAENKRNALWGDAHQSMGQAQQALRQGTELFQSYRPGGSAALAAGQFSNQANLHSAEANLYGTQALNTEAADMLIRFRAEVDRSARHKASNQFDTSNILAGLKPLSGGNPFQPPASSAGPAGSDAVDTGPGGGSVMSGGAQASSPGAMPGGGAGASYQGSPGLGGGTGAVGMPPGGTRSAGLGGPSMLPGSGGGAPGPSASGSTAGGGGGGVGGASGGGGAGAGAGGFDAKGFGSAMQKSMGGGGVGGTAAAGANAGGSMLTDFGGADVARSAAAISPNGQQSAILGAQRNAAYESLTTAMENTAFARVAAAAGSSSAAVGGATVGGAAVGGATIGGGAAASAALLV